MGLVNWVGGDEKKPDFINEPPGRYEREASLMALLLGFAAAKSLAACSRAPGREGNSPVDILQSVEQGVKGFVVWLNKLV
jgi:hypothetical protein